MWFKDVGRSAASEGKAAHFHTFLNAIAPSIHRFGAQHSSRLHFSDTLLHGGGRGLRGTCPLRQMSTLASGGNLSKRQVWSGEGGAKGGVLACGQIHQHAWGLCALWMSFVEEFHLFLDISARASLSHFKIVRLWRWPRST